jgi:hypothetical protein
MQRTRPIEAWKRGEDGYLPKPDDEEPARRGVIHKWKRHRVESWINSWEGKVPSPGRPVGSGRKPQQE